MPVVVAFPAGEERCAREVDDRVDSVELALPKAAVTGLPAQHGGTLKPTFDASGVAREDDDLIPARQQLSTESTADQAGAARDKHPYASPTLP